MKPATEQIQEILSGTPDNAHFVDLCFDEKPDPNTDYYDEFGSQLNAKGIWTFNDGQAVKPAVLEHLREILELRQEVERLKEGLLIIDKDLESRNFLESSSLRDKVKQLREQGDE